jgi:DNA-binding GntR family transcriptional regulator
MLAYRAATRVTAEILRELHGVMVEMRKRADDGDSLGYSGLNAKFHQVIWAAADHPTASRLVGGLKSQAIRFQYRTILRPGRQERSLDEHEAIFGALKAHDAPGAETAMREHLAQVLDTLQWAIEAQHRAPDWLPG